LQSELTRAAAGTDEHEKCIHYALAASIIIKWKLDNIRASFGNFFDSVYGRGRAISTTFSSSVSGAVTRLKKSTCTTTTKSVNSTKELNYGLSSIHGAFPHQPPPENTIRGPGLCTPASAGRASTKKWASHIPKGALLPAAFFLMTPGLMADATVGALFFLHRKKMFSCSPPGSDRKGSAPTVASRIEPPEGAKMRIGALG